MAGRFLAFAFIVLAVVLVAGPARGEAYGTFECMGVVADLPGGYSVGDIAEVRVYIQDGGSWKRVQNAVRVGFENFYASSVFGLSPATSYDFKVEFYDTSSALVDTQYMSGSTRAETTIPAPLDQIYVSTTGSDGGAGTLGDPFATLDHALSVAAAGTTVYMRGGTYYDTQVYPTVSGTASDPIVIRAYGVEKPVLDGADSSLINTTWSDLGGGVYSHTCTLDPRNVCLKRKSDGVVFRSYMMGTAAEVTSQTSEGYTFAELNIDTAYCADGADITILVPGGVIGDYDVYVSKCNTGIYFENRAFFCIDGLTLTHYGANDYSRAIYVYSSSDILVQNCKFLYNNVGVWVKNDSFRVTVQDNVCVDDTADWHFSYTKSQGVQYHSEVETGLVTCGGTYGGRGLVVRRNTIQGLFDGAGLAPFSAYTAATTAETEFYDNTMIHIADDFMEIDGYARNVRVFRNYMRESLSGISFAQALDGPTWIVRNVIADCGLCQASTNPHDYPYESYPFKTNGGPHPEIGSGEVFFYHNTAYTQDTASRAMLVKSTAIWRKFTFRNNIWCGKWRGFDCWNTTPAPMDWDYDCLYTASGAYVIVRPTTYNNIDEVRAARGWLLNGTDAWPEFADADGGDYTLTNPSPCIDTGVVLAGINEDYAGTAPDMGAFEYGGGSPGDTDGDGLPDGWETDHFGDLDETADGDPDGDGATNIEEYNAGTDPTQEDSGGPVVSSVSTVPSVVRQGVDDSVMLLGLADDSSTGNSNIAAGEYFVGADPGPGSAVAMGAVDGTFDSPAEGMSASIDTASWIKGFYRIYLRALDAGGFWGTVGSVLLEVADGVAPAAAGDLTAAPALSFDEVASDSWESLGEVLRGEQEKIIDLGALESLGAVSLEVRRPVGLFPLRFRILASPDGDVWEMLVQASSFRRVVGRHLWLFEEGDYRYVKLIAAGRLNRNDGHYYVRIPEVVLYRAGSGNFIRARWTATADDANRAASGPASVYDLRYSASAINESNFAACESAGVLAPPGPKGTQEDAAFSVGLLSGRVYVALKIADEVPNWSSLSNVASTRPSTVGFKPLWPEDSSSVGAASAIQFTYLRDTSVWPAFISFSNSADFPRRPQKNEDGTTSRRIRYRLRRSATYWRASRTRWKAIKKLAGLGGAVYWRLEGRSGQYKSICGPARAMFFETGMIPASDIEPKHDVGGEDALWPDAAVRPTFSWTDETVGMKYFHVDVSSDPQVPLKPRRMTVVVGDGKVSGQELTASRAEWKRIRRLAGRCGGVLYWRVRALDRRRALACASEVKRLVIDGGQWTLSDVDLSSPSPTVTWSHDGEGIVWYNLQLSVSEDFPARARLTVLVPARATRSTSHTLGPRQVTRLKLLATRNGASVLYYRVRGRDADEKFVTYSEAKTTPAP